MGQIPQFMYYPNAFGFRGITGSSTFTNFIGVSMTSDTMKDSVVLQATRAGSLRKIHFIVVSVATDATLDIRVETIDSTGNPTGTLWATNTNVTHSTHAAGTWYAVTLTADATFARGDKFAVVFQRSGAGAISISIGTGFENSGFVWSGHFPRRVGFNGASWAKDDIVANIGLEMSDGSFMPCGNIMHTGTLDSNSALQFRSGDASNEEGNLFTAPFTAKVVGLFARLRQGSAAGGQFQLSLYDGSIAAPASALAQCPTEDSTTHLNTNYGVHMYFFPTPTYIIEGKTYRVCAYSAEATFGIYMERLRVSNNAHLLMSPGGINCYRTSRAQAGPGTFSDTNTEVFPGMGLVIDEIVELTGHPAFGGLVA